MIVIFPTCFIFTVAVFVLSGCFSLRKLIIRHTKLYIKNERCSITKTIMAVFLKGVQKGRRKKYNENKKWFRCVTILIFEVTRGTTQRNEGNTSRSGSLGTVISSLVSYLLDAGLRS